MSPCRKVSNSRSSITKSYFQFWILKNFLILNRYPAKTQTLLHTRWSLQNRWFSSRSLRSNSIGFVIENLSYNWSIITYRNSNTNSVGVFHCIKLIYGTLQRRGTYPAKTQTLFFARSSSLERSVDKFDTMKNSYRICI